MKRSLLLKICLLCGVAASGVFFSSFSYSKADNSSSTEAWSVRCDKGEDGVTKHCEMFTRLNLQKTNQRVVEFAIGYKEGETKTASGVAILPLGIMVQEDVVFLIDENPYFQSKVSYCLDSGCYSQVALPEQIITKMKKGSEASLRFKSVGGRPFEVKMSLAGFTKTLKEIRGRKK